MRPGLDPLNVVAVGRGERPGMYVVVQHQIKDAKTAFSRGERLIRGDGAPPGVRVCSSIRAGMARR
jgi:hypothetical protein